MSAAKEKWTQVREAVGHDRLSVLVPAGSAAGVRAALADRGVLAEVVETDGIRYRDRAAALRAAFELTTGEFVFVLESAAEANLGQLPVFLGELIARGADVVVGSKRHPDSQVDYPLRRRFMSWAYYFFVRHFIGLRVTDTQTGVMLFRRATLGYALERMLSKAHAFDLEILAIAAAHGARIREAPVVLPAAAKFDGLTARQSNRMIRDTLAVFYRARILDYYRKSLVPKRLDHDPFVSIVIACPGGSWMLDECLAAISRQTYANWECIVLPDGDLPSVGRTSDGSGRQTVRVIPTGKVRPAEKRNLGIREARGEIVAFIDDDAYPDPHWLEYAVKYFGEKTIGAVGGPGVTPPGDRWLAKIGGRVYDNPLVSGNYRYRYKAGGVRMDVDDYPSCNLFVRKSILDRIGGYRTDFWPGEDTLLCKDIIDGWNRIIYEPWVVVYHHRRPLFAAHLRQLGRYAFHRGYFCKRYPSNSLRLAYFVPSAFLVYFWALAVCAAAAYVGFLPLAPVAWASVPLALYALMTAVTSFSPNPVTWALTALGVLASHLRYGRQFIQGLCAKKAPCEYIGKDHAQGRG